ncbi:hypothetical protein [Nocardia aurea]|uniref:Uncharacterized protein n=1 Tax=Nocardia aurea TaxID=2144174 RepID=A0ABV3G1U5_9NOCA
MATLDAVTSKKKPSEVSAEEFAAQELVRIATARGQSRLNAEFPEVAEYLDTAPMLSETGNRAADQAFDPLLLHDRR